jgi:predicted regulator of Ras-like GTPase activity (Roadblock/LC7/MglB family)
MRSQEIQQTLEKLKASSADIEAAALVSQEGFIIASVLSENLDEERVAALTAAFQGLAERCGEELGKGKPRQFFLQADLGYIVVMEVTQDACLTVLSSRFGKPGMLLLDMRRGAEQVRALL